MATDADIHSAIHRVGLDPKLRTKVRNYSLGMKQKLALAQAFMEGQQLLLLDEPFNGLDDASTHATRALLRELNDEGTRQLMGQFCWAAIQLMVSPATNRPRARVSRL
ncbi:MAG: ATP-binding cassette domain-containing protein [Propionibacteriaceae bacterium]|nr:ATP-binding cassette domain-containing protein [Propionibacteriaceae bacterium]